jgi:flagellar biosynthesis protein FliQ
MTPEIVIELGRDALFTLLRCAMPMLLAGMAIGLLISIIQAATQVNEMTMTFVPKIVAVLATGVIFLPWIISNLVRFTNEIFARIAAVGVS